MKPFSSTLYIRSKGFAGAQYTYKSIEEKTIPSICVQIQHFKIPFSHIELIIII